MTNNWEKAQKYEKEWWGDCVNTYGEEMKQLLYAEKMGLIRAPIIKTPYRFDLQGKSVLDIGGGPVSLLLKCVNFRAAKVIDPLPVPNWVRQRYQAAGITYKQQKAEDMKGSDWWYYDEIWIYNVLPHCENPQKVIENAKKARHLVRIFEWIDTPIGAGHISSITEKELNEWLGGEGKVEQLTGIAHGKAYYGIFPTKRTV